MSSTAVASHPAPLVAARTRWIQLLLGLICMMAISSPQYVWALFTKPLTQSLGVPLASLQLTFTLLIVLQTFFSPAQGWLVDRFGARMLISIGTGMTGLSWVLAAYATSLPMLYLTYGLIGGIGTGIVYVGVVGQMVAWFPDRRGFAAGVVAAGYGMGAIVTTLPISETLASSGLQATFLRYGLIFGIVGLLAAQGLRSAPARARVDDATDGVTAGAMLRTPVFWLMFAMMSMMSTSGLMVTSQLGAFAAEFGITKMTVWGMAALPLALTIDRFTNGLTRPFFGWVSDRIGRENTMCIAFALEGVAMYLWLATRADPVLFVLLSGVVFFGWGEIFSLFPSTLTDTFGARHATRNYGFLYMAQGIGAIFGAYFAVLLHDATGGWETVFGVAIAADLLTAALAITLLKPMRRRYLAGL